MSTQAGRVVLYSAVQYQYMSALEKGEVCLVGWLVHENGGFMDSTAGLWSGTATGGNKQNH